MSCMICSSAVKPADKERLKFTMKISIHAERFQGLVH